MCGGGGSSGPVGPTKAELDAAARQRAEAAAAQQEAAEEKAGVKREDIEEALSARVQRQGKRGGKGRRSLFSSSSGSAGYLQRFK